MRLGDLLITKGLITHEELEIALSVQRITGKILGRCLNELGFITPQELASILAIQHGLEYIDVKNYPVQKDLVQKFPRNVTFAERFLPLEEKDGLVEIAIVDPGNILAVDRVRMVTGKRVKTYLTDEESFADAIEKIYYFIENPTDRVVNEINTTVLNTGTLPPEKLPYLVESIIAESIRRSATDIHISVNAGVLSVAYRVDGILEYAFSLPQVAHAGVVSRLKVLSRINIAEQRLPQDGSFIFDFLGRKYEVRVSTIPTIEGESVVMRILFGGSEEIYRLSKLGFNDQLVDALRGLIRKPHGIILIVGPTGSGKSTTLYSLLKEVNRLKRSVITIEDPVEYRVSFAKQSQVNEKIGYDFALAGRNFMRHDPDIILLGEIRDEETARIAIRASITGHLVLSTLHANDAVSAIPRLVDLGADRFLLSSSLLAVLSQRLIRKICSFCKTEREPDGRERELLHRLGMEINVVFYGRGCNACRQSGFLGRSAVGELMVLNDELKEMVYSGASYSALVQAARRAGMVPLMVDGLRKIKEGVSTLSEVERILG
ncbi:MAG: ATPase, T2SS/T4P/T4SS family [Syntrophales bacterium]|nr:ATPase, T2SS/T4P/T4SS family [Syntrophales bacterium]